MTTNNTTYQNIFYEWQFPSSALGDLRHSFVHWPETLRKKQHRRQVIFVRVIQPCVDPRVSERIIHWRFQAVHAVQYSSVSLHTCRPCQPHHWFDNEKSQIFFESQDCAFKIQHIPLRVRTWAFSFDLSFWSISGNQNAQRQRKKWCTIPNDVSLDPIHQLKTLFSSIPSNLLH